MSRHLPKYVHSYVDRHGKARFYVRRPGYKQVALPGLAWSPEFMTSYAEAMAGDGIKQEIGAKNTITGTMHALAVSYFQSAGFLSLRHSTQKVRRWQVETLCKAHADKRVALLTRAHIDALIASKADKPGTANGLRMALRCLMQHAVAIGLRSDDPTATVKKLRYESEGHHSWTEQEIARFMDHHPAGSRARLALLLLLHTGQRRGDLIRMGRQHIRDGAIYIRQEKTGRELLIPLPDHLLSILQEIPNLTFLTTGQGKPLAGNTFGNWFRDECNAAGLPHCSAHGLRHAVARRLAEAGCTTHEIAAITGHTSLKEVERYTGAADQKRLALAAVAKVKP
jgi:integrase